jgi:hypothetical protein
MPSGKSECEKTHKRLIKTRGEVRAAEIVTRAPPVDTEIVIQLMMLPLTLFVFSTRALAAILSLSKRSAQLNVQNCVCKSIYTSAKN